MYSHSASTIINSWLILFHLHSFSLFLYYSEANSRHIFHYLPKSSNPMVSFLWMYKHRKFNREVWARNVNLRVISNKIKSWSYIFGWGQISMPRKQEEKLFWCSCIKNIKHNPSIKKETLWHSKTYETFRSYDFNYFYGLKRCPYINIHYYTGFNKIPKK